MDKISIKRFLELDFDFSIVIGYLNPITHPIFVAFLGFYLILNLQWYNYKISRVLTKHHKVWWHIVYFALPFILERFTGVYFLIFFYFAYLPSLYIWYKKIDKKLVFTDRVKRFFFLLISLTLFQDILCYIKPDCTSPETLLPILVTWLGSTIFEKIIFLSYKSKAKRKLQNLHNLQIIAVTGSYGKTSIKNFLFQILSRKFRVQTTPRSVNTIGGIVRDINENLLNQTEIYVVEAGARERGDILEIARFLEHHLAIVGKIGEQHIEYFKTIENILDTKLEIVKSKNLQRVYLHTSVGNNVLNKRTSPFRIEYFANDVGGVVSDIDGTNFNLKVKGEYHRFQTPLIGAFQAENLDVVVRIAVYYGFSIDDVREAILDLKPVENRLQKFRVGGKLILDDGYNGNLDGMLEAFRIVEKSKGRKIVVTPGLVESSNEQNERIAFEIDDVFDVVIITGSLNQKLFKENLKNPHALRIFLEDKSKLEQILSKYTNRGDIILFANDAPNFI